MPWCSCLLSRVAASQLPDLLCRPHTLGLGFLKQQLQPVFRAGGKLVPASLLPVLCEPGATVIIWQACFRAAHTEGFLRFLV